MADDKKLNKPNSIEDSGFEAIKNIGRKYESRTALDAQERLKLQTAAERIQGLEELIEDRPELAKSKTIVNGISEARETLNRFSPKVSLRRETHRERAIKETQSSLEREFSQRNIGTDIGRAAGSSSAQARGFSMVGKTQRELEKERAQIVGQIGGLEDKATGIVQNELYDKEGRQNPQALDEVKSAYRQKRALVNKAAAIEAAMSKKKQEGTDDKSLDRSLLEIGKSAQKTLFRENVRDELKSGSGLGSMSTSELKEKEVQQSRALVEALEKLKNSAGESAENIDKLRDEAKEAGDGLKKTQEAIKQGGGGGIRDITGKQWAAMGAGLLNTAAAAGQEIAINQPMQALGNRLGYAQLANQQYAQRNSAIGGDMTALLVATSDVGKKMSEVGNNFKENAEIVRGLNIGAGAITAGIGGYTAIHGAAEQANILGQGLGTTRADEIITGTNTFVSGAAQVATSTADLVNQSSTSSAKLGGEQMIYAIQQEVAKIKGDFLQNFHDYSMGTRAAALNVGGAGGRRVMDEFAADNGSDTGLLGRMQKARIDPKEFARLSAEAGLGQGSVFDTNQVFQARNLERSGVGTVDLNMQRMTQLAAAGANNPQTAFASVIEAAFSKGLDSSKALNMMVSNTSELVRGSTGAALGLDTTASSAKLLSQLTSSKEDVTNREAALERAKTAADIVNNMSTGIGSNFTDQLAISRIAKAGGTDTLTAMNLKSMKRQDIDALQSQLQGLQPGDQAGETKLRKKMFDLGILKGYQDESGRIDTKRLSAGLQTTKTAGILSQGAFLNQLNPNMPGYKEWVAGQLSEEEILNNPKYAKFAGALSSTRVSTGLSGSEVTRALSTKPVVTTEGKSLAEAALAGEGGTGALRDADTAATAAAADNANKARQSAKELGGAGEALSKISVAMQSLVEKLNDKSAGNFQGAATEAASSFSNAASVFNASTGQFKDAVDAFARIPTSTGAAVKDALKPITDKLDAMGSIVDGKQKSGAN